MTPTMTLPELVHRTRSYRRFDETHAITRDTLLELVDLARVSASAANHQPLKYCLVCEPERNRQVFDHLAWAGYLKDWPGPGPGERPAGYIVVLGDTTIQADPGCDHGIAVQSILLGATAKGLGGCLVGSVRRRELRRILDIPEHLKILLVVALGKPVETVIIDPLPADGSIRYWRDDQQRHHVPKRSLDEIVLT